MRRLIDTLLKLIYPALLSLFVYAFTAAFVNNQNEYFVFITFFALSIFIFSLLFFLVGFIMNIIYCIKHKGE